MTVLRKYSDLSEGLDLLSKDVVDSCFKVHKALGSGYLEKIYEDCLAVALNVLFPSFLRSFGSSRKITEGKI
ncbi:MAG: hypothetical protein KDJ75_08715 [Alphaproteobacteria bacterium]|nr:hypothetical protein [Alphaproteobacteria bacterium]